MLSTLGRLDEAEGDRKGVPNWLSTHPEPLQRVQDIQPAVQKLKSGRTNFVTGREALLQRVDGLVFGDNPSQGITRGSTFLHSPLRFRIEFPSGWEVTNSPRQVVAKAPGADVFMLLQLVSKPQGTTAQEVATASMRSAGFTPLDGERTTVNGLEAHVGLYQGQIQGLGEVVSRAAHIRHNNAYYLVAGVVSSNVFRQVDATFLASIRSFRPLSAAEAAAIRPHRVVLHVVRAGDTWASLAERSAGAVKPVSLAVMNHAAANSQPPVGTQIKIVVAD
jgi:predicted Zn-dependent protease